MWYTILMSNCYSQSELSKITKCSRANISKLTKKNPPILIAGPDGKIDIEDPTNCVWYETRMLKIDGTSAPQVPKNPAEKKKTAPKKQKSAINSEKTIESETDQAAPSTPDTPRHTTRKTEKSDEDTPKDESMAARKMRLEVENLQEKLEKSKIENKKARASLVEVDTLGMAVFGYLIALNKNMLSIPKSYIDEFAAALKAGKSKTELTDILTKPISAAIVDSRDQIKKELERYKRATKQNHENTSEKNEE